ncbi:MAG: class I SAM-dependent methyltransferase [Mongoliitalea sp.]
MSDKTALLKELYSNISTTGALSFSSKRLVNKMISYADFKNAKLIVEMGGGDGSITRGIMSEMGADAELLVFEVNEYFCQLLKKEFQSEQIQIICDSAANIDTYIQGRKVDLILSSLPLSLIDKDVKNSLYQKSVECLSENGRFIQICYSYFLRFEFRRFFKQMQIHFTLKNFPPVFIMVCK